MIMLKIETIDTQVVRIDSSEARTFADEDDGVHEGQPG